MHDTDRQKIVIAGGGTAGWMAAAAISGQLRHSVDVVLVESDAIGTVGVGEATIPPLRAFHRLIGVDEREFMRATFATFKLGIDFQHWGRIGDSYIHSFGSTGPETWVGGFQHFWLRGFQQGVADPFGEYCFELQAAKAGKFALTQNPQLNYAYHLDATRYARFLRKLSEDNGARRMEGKIGQVVLDPESGDIDRLVLESGEAISGDIFIDCTGFRGLLIEQALHTGYDDWSHWLPCNSAVAVQTESTGDVPPYTRSIAHDSGWQWRIPLQHRVGNGLVFCSEYLSDDEATQRLLDNIEGRPITEPRVIKFTGGRRRVSWNKNCVALGLAGGFIEPLESTSIHLIMNGVIRLMRLLSLKGVSPAAIDEYNRQMNEEIEHILDFIVLHYHATARDDSEFWRYCRRMAIPDSLAHRIELFKETGQVFQEQQELFRVDSWTQVMLGQGLMPESRHPVADVLTDEQLRRQLSRLHASIKNNVSALPSHSDFINSYCKVTSEA